MFSAGSPKIRDLLHWNPQPYYLSLYQSIYIMHYHSIHLYLSIYISYHLYICIGTAWDSLLVNTVEPDPMYSSNNTIPFNQLILDLEITYVINIFLLPRIHFRPNTSNTQN